MNGMNSGIISQRKQNPVPFNAGENGSGVGLKWTPLANKQELGRALTSDRDDESINLPVSQGTSRGHDASGRLWVPPSRCAHGQGGGPFP